MDNCGRIGVVEPPLNYLLLCNPKYVFYLYLKFMTYLWEGSYYAFVVSIPLKMWLALLADDSEH